MRLVTAVSQVGDGNMSFVWGERDEVETNRVNFLRKLNLKLDDVVRMKLKHGDDFKLVSKKDRGNEYEVDALITNEKRVGLWMVTADCLPVVLFDKKKGLVALVHLGWRGVDLRLAEKVVQELIRLGSESSNIYATIGPGVRKGSYMKWGVGWKEFVEEVDMGEWGMFVEDVGEKRTIDLVGFVESQLKSVGVEKIDVSGTDTVSDMRYFSHHRSYLTGEPEGRFATVAIML